MPYVAAPSDIARAHAEKRLAALATPPGALGRLGDLAVWVAACQGQVPPAPVDNVRLVIFAGDHGVAAHGVSAFPPAITGAMVRTFLLGKAGVSALANAHGVAVRVLDLGVDEDFDDLDEQVRTALTAHKIRRGSGAIHIEDALTPERDARPRWPPAPPSPAEEIAAGAQLLISGDMGIGNTTPAAAMVAAGLGLPASEVVGRGTGIDDEALLHKAGVIAAALARAGARTDDPIETLTALGSADLAASTGFLLAAAQEGTPVLLDGLMSVACALTADRHRARRRRRGTPPATAPPSPPSRSRWRRWGSSRSSTSGCDSARAPVPWPPCRSSAARPRSCATSRCCPSSCPDAARRLAARRRDAHRGPGATADDRGPAACRRPAMVLAPLAVLPLGLAVTCVALAGHWLQLPVLVTALLALGAAILGNRAFHLDGLSDTVDGLAASYDRERSLVVMKSGTSGPAGVVAIVLVLGLQVAALAGLLALPDWWQAAILAGVAVCAARAALVVCCVRGVPAARPDGLGRTYTQTVPRAVAVAAWLAVGLVLALAGAWAGLEWWRGALAAALALGVVVARRRPHDASLRRCHRRRLRRRHRARARRDPGGAGMKSRAVGLLLGYAADRVLGDPQRFHPVAGFGTTAAGSRALAVRRLAGARSRPHRDPRGWHGRSRRARRATRVGAGAQHRRGHVGRAGRALPGAGGERRTRPADGR